MGSDVIGRVDSLSDDRENHLCFSMITSSDALTKLSTHQRSWRNWIRKWRVGKAEDGTPNRMTRKFNAKTNTVKWFAKEWKFHIFFLRVSFLMFCFHFSFSYLLIESEIIQYMKRKLCLVFGCAASKRNYRKASEKKQLIKKTKQVSRHNCVAVRCARIAMDTKMKLVGGGGSALQRTTHRVHGKYKSQENAVSILTRKWLKNCARGHRLRF